ncbi:MAG: helix-turn-helix domain-containing protein, partial [Polynucleobacter victoriensis]
RVGGHDSLKSNVRVIAATHQNLESRVAEGLFREDLFHRLNVIRLRLPSLRERKEDIPLLARHFMQTSAKSLGMEPKRLSDDALIAIGQLPFPGNVRQLENLCHWLTVMAPAQVIGAQDLPPDATVMGADLPEGASIDHAVTYKSGTPSDWESGLALIAKQLLQDGTREVFSALESKFEKAVLTAALEVTRGRRVEAAERLGIGRNTITRKLQELGIDT